MRYSWTAPVDRAKIEEEVRAAMLLVEREAKFHAHQQSMRQNWVQQNTCPHCRHCPPVPGHLV